jgi:hypothetical protein
MRAALLMVGCGGAAATAAPFGCQQRGSSRLPAGAGTKEDAVASAASPTPPYAPKLYAQQGQQNAVVREEKRRKYTILLR